MGKNYEVEDEEIKVDEEPLIDYWDYYRFKWHGRVSFRGYDFKTKLLTHTSPYIKDCIEASIENINSTYENSQLKLIFINFQIHREPCPDFETILLKAPKIEVICDLNWNCS